MTKNIGPKNPNQRPGGRIFKLATANKDIRNAIET